jgi:hypothetical protein
MLEFMFLVTGELSQALGSTAKTAHIEGAAAATEAAVSLPDYRDPFTDLKPLGTAELRTLSGRGAQYGFDLSQYSSLEIGAMQSNDADLDGTVNDTVVTDTVTGNAANNQVTGNSGFTTVFINTGNNVVLQSSVQVNIYTPATEPQ